MIKKIKHGLLNAAIVLTASASLFCSTSLTTFADSETVTIGDITYERTSETVGGKKVDTWVVTQYHGSDTDVIIPDAINADASEEITDVESSQLQENLLAGNMITEVSDTAFGDGVESIRLPGYLMKAKSNMFDDALDLQEISGAGKQGNNGFITDGTALYKGKTLFVFPKAYTGSYEVMDGTNKYTSKVFSKVTLEKLVLKGDVSYGSESAYNTSLFIESNIGTIDIDSATVDEKTFLGSKIGRFEGSNTNSGSIMKNNELIYFGFDSNLDLSNVSAINSVAFQTEALYHSVESQIPESIKEKTVFRFYNGAGSGHTQRYFSIDGKTAFCYDYGKDNPELVGDLLEYDNTIEPNTAKYNQIRALLYGGVPNNGNGLFEEVFGTEYDELAYGLDGDAAKNAVGALVWEIVSGRKVDMDNIYGIDTEDFPMTDVENYVEALRSKYIDKADTFDLNDFELGFYHPKQPSSAQRLVVINKIYRPDPVDPVEPPEKPSVNISKQDITTKQELPGANLKVVKEGVVIDEWVSTEVPHVIKDLEDGTYELVETTAPNGYLIAESITFTVTDGKVSNTNIVMYDIPEINEDVYISKKDVTTGEELPGAKLVLKMGEEIIAQWTSTNEPYKLTNLKDGTYVLTEVLAPKGYEIAESITFIVKDGKSDTPLVVMYDAPIEVKPTKPTKPSKPGSDPKEPETPTKTPITEINEPTIAQPEEIRELPVTGDIGGVVMVVAGVLLIMSIGIFVRKKANIKIK